MSFVHLVNTTHIMWPVKAHPGRLLRADLRHITRVHDAANAARPQNFQFFTQALTEGAFKRLILENALRSAVERNELLLMYTNPRSS